MKALEDFLTSKKSPQVFIVEGKRGSGKNTACEQVISKIQKRVAHWQKPVLAVFGVFVAGFSFIIFLPDIIPHSFIENHSYLRRFLFILFLVTYALFIPFLCLFNKRDKELPFSKYSLVSLHTSVDIEKLEKKISDATVNIWNAGKKVTPIGKFWINVTLPAFWTTCILLPIYAAVRFFSIFSFLKDFLKVFSIPSVVFASVYGFFSAFPVKNTLIHIHHAELLKGLDVGVFVDFIKRLTQENCKVLLSFEDTADKDVKAFLSALKIAFGSPYVFQLPSKEVAYLAFEKEDKAAYGALFEVLEETLVEKHIELFTIAKRSCEALKRWHELVVAVAWEETVSEKALWEKLTPLTIDGLISLKEHQEFKMTANEEDRPLEQCCCANIDDQAYLLNFPDGKKALRAAVIRLKKDK